MGAKFQGPFALNALLQLVEKLRIFPCTFLLIILHCILEDLVRISAKMPEILAEAFTEFPQSLQVNTDKYYDGFYNRKNACF
jgi:hypothetical protein